MPVKDIVLYTKNEAALRKKSEPVRAVNQRLKKIIKDLKDTLLDHPEGIGLAAPQINIHTRVIVVRLGSRNDENREPDAPIAIINPEIIEAGDEQRDYDGCLSFPGLYADTIRPHYLHITGLDERGRSFEHTFTGFDAVLVHHEIDHLNGVLFIDRIESVNDLYWLRKDENDNLVRVPIASLEAHKSG